MDSSRICMQDRFVIVIALKTFVAGREVFATC
jgi:hypothetical protein